MVASLAHSSYSLKRHAQFGTLKINPTKKTFTVHLGLDGKNKRNISC